MDKRNPLVRRLVHPILRAPRYTIGCLTDPTGGIDKQTAEDFVAWTAQLLPTDLLAFFDGSEKTPRGTRKGVCLAIGHGALNPMSHVFDAEAVGAWKAIERALALDRSTAIPDNPQKDPDLESTSFIWCVRGETFAPSQ